MGAPLLVALLIPMVDFGIGFYHQMQVQDAAQAGAQYALIHGWNSANSNAIQLAVTNATSLTSISPSPAPVESCGCPQGTSVAAVSCGGTCTNGQTAGTYVTVSATAIYYPLLTYSILGQSVTLTAQAMARIQ